MSTHEDADGTAHPTREEQRRETLVSKHNAIYPRDKVVDHPAHYGGADDPFEAIKVIEAWSLNFSLGCVLKYLRRADAKGAPIEDLEKARWYLDREIARRKETR